MENSPKAPSLSTNPSQRRAKVTDPVLGGLVIIGLYLLAVYSLVAFCNFIGFDVVGFAALRLHNDRLWAFFTLALFLIPCLFSLALAVGAIASISKGAARLLEARKRCTHGIRKASKQPCAQCSAEIAAAREEWQQETAEREFREKRLLESAALRSEEIARLSRAWISQSESYFSMSPREFEDAIARLFIELGYEVEQTPYSNDGGKDAIVRIRGKKYVVECKRYGRDERTGRRDLQILLAAMHDVSADGAFFISTGRFARTAVEYAEENHIRLYDGDHLPILVNEAFGARASILPARVMCDVCGEVVLFDIFRGEAVKQCKNLHQVICSIRRRDLKIASTLETPVCPDHGIPMNLVEGRWRSFWGCSEYPRCHQRILLRRPKFAHLAAPRNPYLNSRTPRQDAPRQQLELSYEADVTTEQKTSVVNTWAPILKQNDEPTLSLMVRCGKEAPDLAQYKMQLEGALISLIESNPKQARRDMEEISPPDSPSLSNILTQFEPAEWAVQIMSSPQMTMLLNRIDWQETSPVKEQSVEELPSLMDILQMLP
jgi:hypothetical protein